MSNSVYTSRVNPKRILKILLGITISLAILNVIAMYLRFFPERYHVYSRLHEFFLDIYIDRFIMNTEMNFPTYFATFQLLAASILLFIIAAWKKIDKDKYRHHWKGLAFLLLLFSVDEFTAMHERLEKLFRDFPDFNGLFFFKWVIPGIAFLLLFGLLYLMFFFHLEKKYKFLFLSSAFLFFGGALGLEIIGGRFANYNDTRNFTFHMLTTIEETLELGGIALLIYSLLEYIKTSFPDLHFSLESEQTDK